MESEQNEERGIDRDINRTRDINRDIMAKSIIVTMFEFLFRVNSSEIKFYHKFLLKIQ